MARTAMTARVWVCAVILGLAASAGVAADYVWTGGGGADTSWSNTANWDGTVAPDNGDNVTFGTGGSACDSSVKARTVGLITLDRAGGFELTGNQNLTINTGITVGAVGSYTITRPGSYLVDLGGDNTWDVPTGASLAVNAPYVSGNGRTLTKTGGGTVYVTTGYQRYFCSALDIQGGTVDFSGTSDICISGMSGTGTFVANSTVCLGRYVTNVDTDCQGVMYVGPTVIYKDGTHTITFSGENGQLSHDANYPNFTCGGGTIRLDNTAVNRDNRLFRSYGGGSNPAYFWNFELNMTTLELIGNDTTDSLQNLDRTNLESNRGLATVSVTHGAAASATIKFQNVSNNNCGMILFEGNDLASASAPGSYITMRQNPNVNDIMKGYCRVGDEFATRDAALGVMPLAAAGRPSQVEGAAATDNVLATGTLDLLTGNTTINSLKIDGAHALDLDGNELDIASGGLIQTGAANNGIENGKLTSDRLYVQTATDLRIAAELTGTSLTKIGDGNLDVAGALPAGYTIYWADGPLTVSSDSDVTVSVDSVASDGSLTKAGAGEMTMSGSVYSAPMFTGDVACSSGTIVMGLTGQLGTGNTMTFSDGGSLKLTANYDCYPDGVVNLVNGGRLVFAETTAYGGDGMMFNTTVQSPDLGVVINPSTLHKTIRDFAGSGRIVLHCGTGGINHNYGLSPNFTGILDVADGQLQMVAVGGVFYFPPNAAEVHVRSGATVKLSMWGPTVGPTAFSGDGTVLVNNGASQTGATLTSQGGTWAPGDSAGVLTVDGHLTLAVQTGTATINPKLDVEVTGDGGVAGTDHDTLVVVGNVNGIGNADLVVDIPLPSAVLAAR